MTEIEKVLVVDYLKKEFKPTETAIATPTFQIIRNLIVDINESVKIKDKFDNFAFDSLNPLGNEVLDFVAAMSKRTENQIQDYKHAIRKLVEILTASFSYQKSVVLLAHTQIEKEEGTGRAKMTPNIWGKDLPSQIPKLFSEVFMSTTQMKDGKIEYVWRTIPDVWMGFLGSRKFDNLEGFIPQEFSKLYGEDKRVFSALVLGDSHTGKTRSIGTLPGRTILFYLEQQIRGYDSLRVPFRVVKSLKDWIEGKEEGEKFN